MFLGFYDRVAPTMPRFVIVEPSLHTIMAGLACREVSPAAWQVLDWLTSDFVTIPDAWAAEAMRALADGDDTPIVCGESAAGGIAVLLHAAEEPDLYRLLGLSPESQVVLFGLEGATDPEIYERIVGSSADEVFARQEARQR